MCVTSVIKRDEYEGGSLEFGTEVISSKDGRITCLLGASPGASTAVAIMLDTLEKAFPDIMKDEKSIDLLKEIVPFYKAEVDKTLFDQSLIAASETLGLVY